MKLSLQLHPDQQFEKSEAELAQISESFHRMTKAYEVLGDLATRRAYDAARDNLDAGHEAGLLDNGTLKKPPPSCVDFTVTLEELFSGCRKRLPFDREEFEHTKWHKRSRSIYSVKINRGEVEGATFWFQREGDVGTMGRADLVFVLKLEQHPLFERMGDDLWLKSTEELTVAQPDEPFWCRKPHPMPHPLPITLSLTLSLTLFRTISLTRSLTLSLTLPPYAFNDP